MLFDIQNSREFMNLFLPEYGEDGCWLNIDIENFRIIYLKDQIFQF